MNMNMNMNMNKMKAYSVLNLNHHLTDSTLTEEALKHQYRALAKKYHPDKNKSADAIDQFRNVHEAYTYLLKRIHHDDFYNTGEEEDDEDNVFYTEEGYRDDDQVYMDFLKPYTEQLWILKYLFQNKSQRQVIMAIVRKIFSYSIDACIEYLKNVDRGILQIIYDVFSRFKSSLEIEETLLEKIAEILKSKSCANATDNDDDKQNEKIMNFLSQNHYFFMAFTAFP